MENSTERQLALNLAAARVLLADEAARTMPSSAAAHRNEMLATLDQQLQKLLISLPPLSELTPPASDAVGAEAWQWAADIQKQPVPQAPAHATSYEKLCEAFKQRSHLGQTSGVLYWREATENLPPKLDDATVPDAKAATGILMNRIIAQPELAQWLEDARAHSDSLTPADQRNLALMQQQWQEETGLDEAAVSALSLAISKSETSWEETKDSSDFKSFLPHFSHLVQLMRAQSAIMGKAQNVSPYQALLGSTAFNPGLRNETVNQVFGQLREKLPPLIQRISAQQAQETPPLPLPAIPVDVQERVGQRLVSALGLSKEQARLDVSAHPFSSGEYDDIRITTRYREDDILSALMGIIHETGHGLYSLNLPRDRKDQPVGNAQSMWVHESQSLFWEYQVANSKPFMAFLSRLLQQELQVDGPEWSAENLHKLATRVKPSLIRIDADEVTYAIHIVLRHDLEQKLIDGSLAPADVPAAWNAAMKDMLGVDVPDDAHGCMQDVHWPSGAIGYFPAYTFGALMAAQLMETMRADIPDMDDHIREGNFAPLRTWLESKIHRHGALYDGEALVEHATGKPLTIDAFLRHLERNYLAPSA